MVEPDRPLTTI